MNINSLHINSTSIGKPRVSRTRGVLYLLLLSFFFFSSALRAQKQASLITAWPGSEIYELCGHEAIRISGDGIDSVWNFGIFNFDEPNFVYRFVKGETDYMVDAYPFSWFLAPYVQRGSRVEEQVLNLTPDEVDRLQKLLNRATTPPNNRYRYNYIKNNCSTKVADILDSVAGGEIVYPDTVRFASYRDAMRGYHVNYPWYQFGIDVALGSGLEEPLSARKELFIPVEFFRHAAKATLPDGRPLVKSTDTLFPGSPNAVDGPTPFLLTPLWVSIVIAAITLLLIACCWRKNCIPRWWYAFYFTLAGLAGCLVAFLVCISSHAATSPNLLIFWLNPLQLIIPFSLWSRRMRYPLSSMMWLNLAVVTMLLVLCPIFNKGQAGQTSLLILMATDIVLAAYYLYASHRRDSLPVSFDMSNTRKGSKNKSSRKNSTRNDSSKNKGIKIRTTRK